VGHLLSIVFFFGLLAALAVVLEFTLREHWAAIVAALRGVPTAPAAKVETRARPARPPLGAPCASPLPLPPRDDQRDERACERDRNEYQRLPAHERSMRQGCDKDDRPESQPRPPPPGVGEATGSTEPAAVDAAMGPG